ncbi:MAG: hypothetical protein M3384_13320 [Acidobacteriota bacterium]|nr:hypothetical protein [Acidobacteriota bacterium]
MKKQTNLHSIKLLSLAMVAVITIIIGASLPTSAQDQPTYKVGDRVEAKPVSSWKKATIVAIDMSASAAVVRMDDEKDYTGAQKEYTTHINNLRPLQETAEEKQTQAAKQAAADKNVVEKRVDANNTVLADREILACPVEQKAVKKGSRPNSLLLSKLIRCLWEKPAREGMDGAVTMDLTPIQIGAPRAWNPRRDLGGSAGTIVYPVKTTYTRKTFYRERTEVDEYTGVFNCSIDPFGEWKCGMAENKRKGESKSIPVKK